AKGIRTLAQLMSKIGDVIVVAPDWPQSGQSNAITVSTPIRFRMTEQENNITYYSCSGTPTDCVKLALNEILDRKPDLLVSGINHGSNAGINVIYSGTMGATFEGCENGIPSVGFSLTDHSVNADFSYFEPYILSISKAVLEKGMNTRVCLNVNAPVGKIIGTKVVRQCNGYWAKEFEKRSDPRGNGSYFWMTGYFENVEPQAQDTDEWALSNGYISIVPTTIDMTAYAEIENMKKWELK
ncbi:5'/3'-nucleotidase SurE, partial [Paludibacteraceae bacterium OttesenSCG-928-F17]|nr:5'/3'-nucleotidase SurE [Paludibacteraceae bacterium OttesenSCG-928-F17]